MFNKKLVSIELKKADMKFSAGHFTVFSATERERLHGHNYQVTAKLETIENESGISFDYNIYKRKVVTLCETLDEFFLLPGISPFLTIENAGEHVYAVFNQERIPFLKKDVCVLPVPNITVEALSRWFLNNLISNEPELKKHGIVGISISVFASPYQSATTTWVIE